MYSFKILARPCSCAVYFDSYSWLLPIQDRFPHDEAHFIHNIPFYSPRQGRFPDPWPESEEGTMGPDPQLENHK